MSKINRTTKHQKVAGAACLYRRWYQHEDGHRTAEAWIWRSTWKGKVRELCIAPVCALHEQAAVEMAKACNARKHAKWPYDAIAHEIADFLVTLADQDLAGAIARAQGLNPIEGASYEALARDRAEAMKAVAAAIGPKGGV